jgi:hypothetical protein
MRQLIVAAILLGAAGCGVSDELAAAKDRESAKATWAMVLRVDGADVRIPLEVMNVLLFKDEEYAKEHPSVFEIKGGGVHLIGEIAAADNVDYGEHWERLIDKTLTIKASGEFHRDAVESKIAIPGTADIAVTGGTMFVEKYTGKWSPAAMPLSRSRYLDAAATAHQPSSRPPQTSRRPRHR